MSMFTVEVPKPDKVFIKCRCGYIAKKPIPDNCMMACLDCGLVYGNHYKHGLVLVGYCDDNYVEPEKELG